MNTKIHGPNLILVATSAVLLAAGTAGCGKKGEAKVTSSPEAVLQASPAKPQCLNLAELAKQVRALPAEAKARVQLVDLDVERDGVPADVLTTDSILSASFQAKDEPVARMLAHQEIGQDDCEKLVLRDENGEPHPQKILSFSPTSLTYAPDTQGGKELALNVEKTTVEMTSANALRITRVRTKIKPVRELAAEKETSLQITSTLAVTWTSGAQGEDTQKVLPSTQPISDRLAKMLAGFVERNSPKRKKA